MKKHLAYFFLPLLAVSTIAGSEVLGTERADVPEKYKWNTTDLYPTEDAWSAQAKNIGAQIPKLADFQGKLSKDAGSFYTALDTILSLDKDLSRLMTYASMRSDEDTRAGKPREMEQTASDLAVKFSSAISFLRPEIIALGEEKVQGFI